MNFLDMASIRLAVGLVLLIAANIALGSINAIIACEWDLVKFRNGCIKGGVIALALVAVYFAGYLNPDLMVVEVDGPDRKPDDSGIAGYAGSLYRLCR